MTTFVHALKEVMMRVRKMLVKLWVIFFGSICTRVQRRRSRRSSSWSVIMNYKLIKLIKWGPVPKNKRTIVPILAEAEEG